MTDAGKALFTQTLGRDDWDLLTPLTRETWDARAAGNLDFLESKSRFLAALPEEEPAEPIPAPEVEAIRLKLDNPEIPRGAKTVMNRFLKNGWTVEVSYARGPWIMTRDWHVCGSIMVRARRGEQRVAVQWIRKEWLEHDEVIPGHIALDVWIPDQVIKAKPNWSNEIMRVNDNQGNPLKAGELKALTEADPS